jgi:dienelactone hydrolase
MKPVSCDSEAARWFLDRGFVVIASMRRGYGETGGYWAEGSGRCPAVDYARAGLESARDIGATVEYAATLPFVRSQGMVLVGQSAGGWGAIAYNTTPHPRVTAIINMAGGRGGHQEFTANSNCRPDLLAAAAGQLARGSTTPMLWVYSENDSFFAPALATAMYSAYTQNGGRADMQRAGPFDNDGHRLFFGTGGSQIWGPMVDRYLASRPGGQRFQFG